MNSNEKSNNSKPSGLLAHIVALMVVMIWGGTFVNTRVLIDRGLLPEEIYVLRTLLGYICIWFISPKKLFCDTLKDELVVLLLGIFGSSLYFLTENYALKLTVANDVSFIVCTTPLVTCLLCWVWLLLYLMVILYCISTLWAIFLHWLQLRVGQSIRW